MNNINKKNGQVILIAFLIMAVVLVVALAIGTLMVRELRMSANIDRSVTAYFAAESGLESAIWEIRKGGKEADQLTLNGEVLEGNGRWDLTFPSANGKFTDQKLEKDKSEQIYFAHDPDNLDKVVNSLRFKAWVPTTAWLEYKVISWPTYNLAGAEITLDPGQIVTEEGLWGGANVTNICIDLNKKIDSCFNDPRPSPCYYYNHIFRFKPLHEDVTYTLVGYETLNKCKTDVPPIPISGGKFVVQSTGTYSAVKRTLQTTFYKIPPIHGIFDYVLFSDESIIK